MNSWWNVNSENRNQGCTFCDDPSRIDNDIIDSVLEDCNRPIRRVDEYINSKEPLDKAGAYGIQGLGGCFINKIEGDFYSIMGLTLNFVYTTLLDLNKRYELK